jgi:hypothetical protein
MTTTAVKNILRLNAQRNAALHAYFNPITGEGSVGERKRVDIADFPIPTQYLPVEMLAVPLVQQIIKHGSVERFYNEEIYNEEDDTPFDEDTKHTIVEQFIRIRFRYDFPFWAAFLVHIKPKGGGADVLFRLTPPQRRLVEELERQRKADLPIRLILLKARQWGGSTTIQMYFAWLQLVHEVGLNSLIVAQVKNTANKIQQMFARMLDKYPTAYLYRLGEAYNPNESKWAGVGASQDTHQIPQRRCSITIGSVEKPDSVRGDDYNLVHLSEVGLWKKTEGKTPEDIVRSACSGVALQPYTAIVYESTANGTGNFFQQEYDAAKRGKSSFKTLFVAWYEITLYWKPFRTKKKQNGKKVEVEDEKAKEEFAEWLWKNRNNSFVASDREESGKYLWWLWTKGATLENIQWYIEERRARNSHGRMASEYPTDDEEAFVHSGARVFDKTQVEQMRAACRPPRSIGDVYADGDEGEDALENLRFHEDAQGMLQIWAMPEIDETEYVTDRYLTVVDVGGRSAKADWSVIVVFDRLFMIDGDKPSVVAQWYGHIDIDLLAWKAAQVAAFYDNSLLVIESNTMDSRDKERHVEGGDQSLYILNQLGSIYPNLYARRQSEDEIQQGFPKKYGFSTNVATKPMIISTLIKIIRENLYVERDARCLDEYLTYERKPSGAYGAITGKHDDLLMTRAIGLHICFNEMDLPQIVPAAAHNLHYCHQTQISEATI